MTLAVRGVVELFRLVKREKELHRKIHAFSVSHDHWSVRIYGHYPIIDGNKTSFYRHPIHGFSFTALDGKEKWTADKFTKNVYDTWVPTQSELHFQGEFGLSQDLDVHNLSQHSNADSASLPGEDDSQSSLAGSQDTTPKIPKLSLSQKPEPGTFKVPKKRRTAG